MNIDINDDSPEEEKGKNHYGKKYDKVGFSFKDTELESLIIHFSSFINPPKNFGFFASFLFKKNTNEGLVSGK